MNVTELIRDLKIIGIHPSLQSDYEKYTKDKDGEEFLFKAQMPD